MVNLHVQEALISQSSPLSTPHPVMFDTLDGTTMQNAALHTTGSAGPSGVDAKSWRRLCTSFQSASADLCNGLASVVRKLCTVYVNPQGITPLAASHLIALDKCTGVRPIGVGETSRRIISKAIMTVIKADIWQAAGALQLCTGQEAGSEAAIHAMCFLFQESNTEGVFLAEASNAFNSLNRKAALHNIHSLCPPLATIITNTYRESVRRAVHQWRNSVLKRRHHSRGPSHNGNVRYCHLLPSYPSSISSNLRNQNKPGLLMMPQPVVNSSIYTPGGQS